MSIITIFITFIIIIICRMEKMTNLRMSNRGATGRLIFTDVYCFSIFFTIITITFRLTHITSRSRRAPSALQNTYVLNVYYHPCYYRYYHLYFQTGQKWHPDQEEHPGCDRETYISKCGCNVDKYQRRVDTCQAIRNSVATSFGYASVSIYFDQPSLC